MSQFETLLKNVIDSPNYEVIRAGMMRERESRKQCESFLLCVCEKEFSKQSVCFLPSICEKCGVITEMRGNTELR